MGTVFLPFPALFGHRLVFGVLDLLQSAVDITKSNELCQERASHFTVGQQMHTNTPTSEETSLNTERHLQTTY